MCESYQTLSGLDEHVKGGDRETQTNASIEMQIGTHITMQSGIVFGLAERQCVKENVVTERATIHYWRSNGRETFDCKEVPGQVCEFIL